ncbi:MAG: dTDP-4-dehydrorhamnose reductase [Planctomycetota bacterium]
MKTLVFGGKGMLGCDLAALSSDKDPVIALGRTDGDITDSGSVGRALALHKPDYAILAAAWTNVDGAEANEAACRAVNVGGAEVCAKACETAGVSLLYISSDYVFSRPGPEPLGEDEPHAPLSAYGRSKSDGEKAVRESCSRWTVVRTSWLFGQHGKNFCQTILGLAQSKPEISVVDDQIGAPTHTAHLAKGLLSVCRMGLRGTLHLAAQGQTSWHGLASRLVKEAGLSTLVNPIPTKEFPRPAQRPQWSIFSQKKCLQAGIKLPEWQLGLSLWLNQTQNIQKK